MLVPIKFTNVIFQDALSEVSKLILKVPMF